MNIEIRDARDGDAEALSPLMEQLMHQPSTPEQIRLRLSRLASTGADRVVVAVKDERVVGLAGLHLAWMVHADAPTARLLSLVVDESCRGQGIGRLLADANFARARAAGFLKIVINVRADNSGAQYFYSALGFQPCGRLVRQAFVDGHYVDELLYELFL